MSVTFATLPPRLEQAIQELLDGEDAIGWRERAVHLHENYTKRKKRFHNTYIADRDDVYAYVGLRMSATYAQIYGALSQIKEVLPNFQPTKILDLGCGPGTGLWAAKEIWPRIEEATCLDVEREFLAVAQMLSRKDVSVKWKRSDVLTGLAQLANESFDVVLLSSVLNECSDEVKKNIVEMLVTRHDGIVVVVEPGTEYGVQIADVVADRVRKRTFLIAPYVHNSYVPQSEYWIHFAQRFTRADFLRSLRQGMRDSRAMASDWEEAKYAYTAFGTVSPEHSAWARCIGDVQKFKGYLHVPLLTKDRVEIAEIWKRYKEAYRQAKDWEWGDLVLHNDTFFGY